MLAEQQRVAEEPREGKARGRNRHCYQRTQSEREREENGWNTSTEQRRAFRDMLEGLHADIRGYSQSGDSLRAEEKDRIEIDQAAGGIRC